MRNVKTRLFFMALVFGLSAMLAACGKDDKKKSNGTAAVPPNQTCYNPNDPRCYQYNNYYNPNYSQYQFGQYPFDYYGYNNFSAQGCAYWSWSWSTMWDRRRQQPFCFNMGMAPPPNYFQPHQGYQGVTCSPQQPCTNGGFCRTFGWDQFTGQPIQFCVQ